MYVKSISISTEKVYVKGYKMCGRGDVGTRSILASSVAGCCIRFAFQDTLIRMYLCKFLNTHPLVSDDVCIGQAKVFSWRGPGARGGNGEEIEGGGQGARGGEQKSRAARRVLGIKEFAILNFQAMAYTYITLYACIYISSTLFTLRSRDVRTRFTYIHRQDHYLFLIFKEIYLNFTNLRPFLTE